MKLSEYKGIIFMIMPLSSLVAAPCSRLRGEVYCV